MLGEATEKSSALPGGRIALRAVTLLHRRPAGATHRALRRCRWGGWGEAERVGQDKDAQKKGEGQDVGAEGKMFAGADKCKKRRGKKPVRKGKVFVAWSAKCVSGSIRLKGPSFKKRGPCRSCSRIRP